MKKKKVNLSKIDLSEKVKRYVQDNQRLLAKYGLAMQFIVNFPGKKKLPFLAKAYLKLLAKQGGRPDLQFIDVSKK